MKKIIIFILSLIAFRLPALTIEKLTFDQLNSLLAHKKVGFYIGSFDPLHKGHEKIISDALKEGIVDYILIYPNWGGDQFKNRTPIAIRQEMISNLYCEHSNVLVTKLPPNELQDLLTKSTDDKSPNLRALQSATEGTKYIGIIGSDTAINTVADKKKLSIFMKGLKIPDKYNKHTIGGIISLPVDEFIVSVRSGDNIDHLKNTIGSRQIIRTFYSPDYDQLSSTAIRKKVQDHEDTTLFLSPEIAEVINKHKLYR